MDQFICISPRRDRPPPQNGLKGERPCSSSSTALIFYCYLLSDEPHPGLSSFPPRADSISHPEER